ncbi:MAG: hypothetical protein SGI74_04310 [Oligoflexia bacterium]|nr:hypothetical protein [Oligoflexia bacterium]
MNQSARCPNMNHGRAQSQVSFCPTCGEKLNMPQQQRCDNDKHLARRKNGDRHCVDCGLLLSKL